MRVLACPASLKGVLTPIEAAAALGEGMRRVDGLEVDEVPLEDGGDGTLEVISRSLGGEWRTARVSDPVGRPVDFLIEPSVLIRMRKPQGDCDEFTMLSLALLVANGIDCEIVTVACDRDGRMTGDGEG